MMTLSHPPNKPYSGLVKYSYFTIYSLYFAWIFACPEYLRYYKN